MFQTFKRGDIVLMNFNPSKGHEQKGYRPALVWTNQEAQTVSGFAVVIPITSHDKNYPLHVRIDNKTDNIRGVIMVDQLISIDLMARHLKLVGNCGKHILDEVDSIVADMTD
ncbi:type II toxin-antitoxin system PemK/MazF family toxin [Pediococcus claussenii]|uniref:PemK-like family protein n=1 Tax=Pediococcus claussenii (strain ATCC BAA-344 / DSM 14800 / JCM 18046 / KCTC 3811 / LMG 21948 / P06) TaxID=701521 RepID=G8PAG5_PEDCP|nr:type II toxin-antitoxin system PemK/MazF family toxin [Pediococcus claussenii]AEV95754.1 pemK-like family protein [Pediococcus claussenii ATCC BAA-344]ANZ69263.1 growth inhibitor PemK [Pediococcus claussenii]ANZ71082.1 growth inhibitor PemK [Pediococcus claussenii]KRN20366.1 hypothetical protein IV79_GL000419 [Pediococcus claussenii]